MGKRQLSWGYWSGALSLLLLHTLVEIAPVVALPVPEEPLNPEESFNEDLPEEILRTEIILEARSPIDGEPLTAAEYAALQEELTAPDRVHQLPSDVQHTIFLLRILRTFRVFSPF